MNETNEPERKKTKHAREETDII